MSDLQIADHEVEASQDGAAPKSTSLAGRIQQRRQELAEQATVTIEVNGYEDYLAAEYHALAWQQTRKIIARHQRVRDPGLQQLYVAAETLIAACEQIYEVTEDQQRVPLNMGWGAALARRCGWEVPEENMTDRRAMLGYIFADHDTWLMTHYGEYTMWLQGQREDDDQEVMSDFGKTQ